MKITVEMLRADEATRFAAIWPDGVEVTEENVLMVWLRKKFNLAWIAKYCFSDRGWVAYQAGEALLRPKKLPCGRRLWTAYKTGVARLFISASQME
jgi:hypothetical protein